jgi:ribokinase
VITVIGDLMLDVFVLSQLQEEEQGGGLVFRAGGSAANTACWLAHLGQTVSFVGCTGNDTVGRSLVGEMAEEGVLCQIREVEAKETGGVAVEVKDAGDRVMRSSRGANEYLCPQDILSSARFEPAYIHLTGYSLLGPFGLEILWAAHQLAVACNSLLSFDPSSRGVIRRFTAEGLLQALTDNNVAVLLLNQDEAEELSGVAEAGEAANTLAKAIGTVVVKDGAQGSVWSGGGGGGGVRTYPIDPLDTTGAGDAFNAGVLSGLINGDDINEACMAGQRCASQVLEQFGGRP